MNYFRLRRKVPMSVPEPVPDPVSVPESAPESVAAPPPPAWSPQQFGASMAFPQYDGNRVRNMDVVTRVKMDFGEHTTEDHFGYSRHGPYTSYFKVGPNFYRNDHDMGVPGPARLPYHNLDYPGTMHSLPPPYHHMDHHRAIHKPSSSPFMLPPSEQYHMMPPPPHQLQLPPPEYHMHAPPQGAMHHYPSYFSDENPNGCTIM